MFPGRLGKGFSACLPVMPPEGEEQGCLGCLVSGTDRGQGSLRSPARRFCSVLNYVERLTFFFLPFFLSYSSGRPPRPAPPAGLGGAGQEAVRVMRKVPASPAAKLIGKL